MIGHLVASCCWYFGRPWDLWNMGPAGGHRLTGSGPKIIHPTLSPVLHLLILQDERDAIQLSRGHSWSCSCCKPFLPQWADSPCTVSQESSLPPLGCFSQLFCHGHRRSSQCKIQPLPLAVWIFFFFFLIEEQGHVDGLAAITGRLSGHIFCRLLAW